jgi:hypothetical protein
VAVAGAGESFVDTSVDGEGCGATAMSGAAGAVESVWGVTGDELGDFKIRPRSAGNDGLGVFGVVVTLLTGGGVLRSGRGFGISSSGVGALEVCDGAIRGAFVGVGFFADGTDVSGDAGDVTAELAPGFVVEVDFAFDADAEFLAMAPV